jgi:WD40 repeat protein
MDFPPRSLNLVTSACKRGRISVWDFEEVAEHTSFEGVHKYQINSLKFIPGRDSMSLLTACCMGHTCLTDIETGMHSKVVDLNPEVRPQFRGHGRSGLSSHVQARSASFLGLTAALTAAASWCAAWHRVAEMSCRGRVVSE